MRLVFFTAAFAAALSPCAFADSVPLLGDVEREAWTFDLQELSASGGDENDVRVFSLDANRSWRFSSGLEPSLGIGLFGSQGSYLGPERDADSYGFSAGFGLRYYAFELGGAEFFLDASAHTTYPVVTQFPEGGSKANFYGRAGLGLQYRLSEDWAVETGWRWGVVTNGAEDSAHDPDYDGSGAFLALRRDLSVGEEHSSGESGDRVWLLGTIDEEAWTLDTQYLMPADDFDDDFRQIDAIVVDAVRSWRFSSGFEAQLKAGVMFAQGETSEPLSFEPPRNSDATALVTGAGLRFYPLQLDNFSLFVEGSVQMLWASDPFPAGGTRVDGLARAGAGIQVPVSEDWAVEAGWRIDHVSNGGGIVAHNPGWDSDGPFLALRRSID